jgi:hypothetical protein
MSGTVTGWRGLLVAFLSIDCAPPRRAVPRLRGSETGSGLNVIALYNTGRDPRSEPGRERLAPGAVARTPRGRSVPVPGPRGSNKKRSVWLRRICLQSCLTIAKVVQNRMTSLLTVHHEGFLRAHPTRIAVLNGV